MNKTRRRKVSCLLQLHTLQDNTHTDRGQASAGSAHLAAMLRCIIGNRQNKRSMLRHKRAGLAHMRILQQSNLS